MNNYKPQPIDTSDVILPDDILSMTEIIAKQVHEIWSIKRIEQGWSYGTNRNDKTKITPCLVSYEDLSEEEKDYDRETAISTLKLIMKLGFKISK